MRLYALGKDFKPTEDKLELKIASMPINCVDINASNSVVVAASKDGFTYILDMKTKQVIQKLSFRNLPNAKNMVMRSCIIRRDNSIYTLSMQAQQPSYLIKWDVGQTRDGKPAWKEAACQQVH